VNTFFVIPQDSQWPRLLHCLDVMSTSLSSANLIIGTLQTIKHPMNTQRLARGCCAAIVALALLGDYWYVIPFTTEVLYGMMTAIAAAFGGVMLVLLPILSEV
jgi:drug/metabolite transporter (DMT)-like permease